MDARLPRNILLFATLVLATMAFAACEPQVREKGPGNPAGAERIVSKPVVVERVVEKEIAVDNRAIASRNSATSGGSSSPAGIPAWDRKIIRTGQMTLETEDVRQALQTIQAVVVVFDGFVASSSISQRDDRVFATIAVQVPPAGSVS